MTTGAQLGIGTKLAFETVIGASPVAFSNVPQVLDFPELSQSREFVETTNQDSQDFTREYIGGLIDVEEVPFEMNYVPGNTIQDSLEDMVRETSPRIWRVTLENASPDVVKFVRAFVSKHSFDGPLADVRKRRITLRLTGPVVDDVNDLL